MDDNRLESWRRREEEMRQLMEGVPESEVERFKAMSYDEVVRRAAAVEASLEAIARDHGSASTVSGSEEDDWLKLRHEMEYEGWSTVGEIAFGRGERWALRLAAHELARDDPARESGVVPSDGFQCFPWHAVVWNWFQRRLLRRPVAPLFEQLPSMRQRRAEVRRQAEAVPPDARDWSLARNLTRVLNGQLPRYAHVEVLPLPRGCAVIKRWGFWSWSVSSSSDSLLDEDGIVNVVLDVQAFAAGQTHRSWPLPLPEQAMRRAHRADPDWSIGRPLPKASLSEQELRIWFGADDAPAFEFPRGQLDDAAPRRA